MNQLEQLKRGATQHPNLQGLNLSEMATVELLTAAAYKAGQEAERERIIKGIEWFEHYYRSKFSIDCSRGETEAEKRTEMVTKKDIINLINSKE